MRRLWAAASAVVVCLVFGGMPALAQGEVVPVTGTRLCSPPTGGVETLVGGMSQVRGVTFTCESEMSDPRVSGTETMWWSEDCPIDHDPCFAWGGNVIEGPEGGWDCQELSVELPPTFNNSFMLGVCVGTGGYEGPTYVKQVLPPVSGSPTHDTWGYITEGPPPVRIVPTEE